MVKPILEKFAELFGDEKLKSEFQKVQLSNDTIHDRVVKMSSDIESQVIEEIKGSAFGLFSFQTDESVGCADDSELMNYVKYEHQGYFKEEHLFCLPLELTTKGEDVFKKTDSFFEKHELNWSNCVGVTSDGPPAMKSKEKCF